MVFPSNPKKVFGISLHKENEIDAEYKIQTDNKDPITKKYFKDDWHEYLDNCLKVFFFGNKGQRKTKNVSNKPLVVESSERDLDSLVKEYKEKHKASSRIEDPLIYLREFFETFKDYCKSQSCTGHTDNNVGLNGQHTSWKILSYKIADREGKRELDITISKLGARSEDELKDYNPATGKLGGKLLELTFNPLDYFPRDEYSLDIEKRDNKYVISGINHSTEEDSRIDINNWKCWIDDFIDYFLTGGKENKIDELDELVKETAKELFTPSEYRKLEPKIEEARFNLGKLQSIPRLNLGPIRLPTPGEKNYNPLIDNAPVLIEYLAYSLGAEEAHRVVLTNLINRITHGQFQTDVNKAREIVSKLRGNLHE